MKIEFLYEMLLVISGFVVSFIITILIFGFFVSTLDIDVDPMQFPLLRNDYEFYSRTTLGFSYITLTFLYLTSPFFGLKFKKYYSIIFYITLVPGIFWTMICIIGIGLNFWALGIYFYITCSSIPIFYCYAWRLNKKYWAKKDMAKSEAQETQASP